MVSQAHAQNQMDKPHVKRIEVLKSEESGMSAESDSHSQVGNPSFKAICAKLGLTTVSDSIRCAESKYCVTQAIHNG